MKIHVNELEKAFTLLITELREHNGDEIEIDKEDFYWSITGNELYNPYEEPKSLTMGQLSDDLEHINKIATATLPPVSYDFVKMSSIFQLIGHKNIW